MRKIIAGAMSLIMLLSTAVLPGCTARKDSSSRETVVLGNYHGKPLEWIILDSNDHGHTLLLSKYVIDARYYDDTEPGTADSEDLSWADSTLRQWLNSDFVDNTFNEIERRGIIKTYTTDGTTGRYHLSGPTDPPDKVFLLSIDEAKRYFAKDEDRRVKPVEDPDSYEGLVVDKDGCCNWWLRSSGFEGGSAASVKNTGAVNLQGNQRNTFHLGVRPAMWVDLITVTYELEVESSRIESEQSEIAKEKEEYEARNPSKIVFKSENLVTFGNYDSRKIEWIVLDKQDDKMLLMTKDIIDCCAYDYSEDDITWEKCDLRRWLNNTFYNQAFGTGEKGLILKTDVENKKNPEYQTSGGNDTKDKVFILSYDESHKYLSGDSSRQAASAVGAKNRNLYVDENGYSFWWLRTPGKYSNTACYVDHLGSTKKAGLMNRSNYIGVRPVIWVTLK